MTGFRKKLNSGEKVTAFITGGASGIGAGMATAFAEAGMRVLLADIDFAGADLLAETLKAAGHDAAAYRLDVGSYDDWVRVVSAVETQFGSIDLLCSNAGVTGPGQTPLEDVTLEQWRWTMDVNLNGIFFGLKAFLPGMKRSGAAHIVITGSFASFVTAPCWAPYNATKYAVAAISRTMRAELEAYDIGVSLLCPNFVKTNLLHTSTREHPVDGRDQSAINMQVMAAPVATGLEPLVVGKLVLTGILENREHIITHPEDRASIDQVLSNVDADLVWAKQVMRDIR